MKKLELLLEYPRYMLWLNGVKGAKFVRMASAMNTIEWFMNGRR